MTQVESPDTSGAVLTACTILLSIETSRTVILRANIGMVRVLLVQLMVLDCANDLAQG